MLELEDAIANLSVIHVAGTKGKVRLLMRFDYAPFRRVRVFILGISMKMQFHLQPAI